MATLLYSKFFEQKFFDARICLLIGGSADDAQEFVEAEHGKHAVLLNKFTECGPLEDDTDGYQWHVNGRGGLKETFYVWIARSDKKLLSHELLHLSFDLLAVRGVEYSDNCEDIFCYLHSELLELVTL